MNSCSSVSGKKSGKRLVPQVEQRKDLIEVDDEDVALLGMQTTPGTKQTETDNVDSVDNVVSGLVFIPRRATSSSSTSIRSFLCST